MTNLVRLCITDRDGSETFVDCAPVPALGSTARMEELDRMWDAMLNEREAIHTERLFVAERLAAYD